MCVVSVGAFALEEVSFHICKTLVHSWKESRFLVNTVEKPRPVITTYVNLKEDPSPYVLSGEAAA